jgi:cyclic pyranopterin phosphate synthase
MGELTHLDEDGRARMVDVGAKAETSRRAVAEGYVRMREETLARLVRADLPKGDAIAAARVAGIMGAKRTPDLIPLCHPVRLTSVTVEIEPAGAAEIRIVATALAVDRTGVEMEALSAVSAASLTIYDMVKGVDRSAYLRSMRLLEKSGGRSGHWTRGQGAAQE